MIETPRLVATSADSDFSLTLNEVAIRYEDAGRPRTIRTLQRYCKSGHLDALKRPTLLGDIYLVTELSVNRHLAQLAEMQPISPVAPRRGEQRLVATSVVQADQQRSVELSIDGGSQSATPVTDGKHEYRYVTRLENENDFLKSQIKVKDDQINDLTERAHETNSLIAGLQRMLSPMLSRRDDLRPPEEVG